MTILVTGGAGFIGATFVLEWLNERDEPVITLDALTYAGNLSNLESVTHDKRHRFVFGSIGDETLVQRLLAEHQIRAIVNFAAESHVDRSIRSPRAFFDTNLMATQGLLEAVRHHVEALPARRRDQFRLVHISTDEVFGTLESHEPAFREGDPFRPNSPYSASKAASDMLVRAYGQTYGLHVLTTHCSNNYGPRQFPEKLIPLMILNGIRGLPLPVYGDGLQVRDWLHVSDHCAAIRQVLDRGRPGETYNIGGHNQLTNLDVIRSICDLLDGSRPRADGSSHADHIAHVTDRRGHDRRYAIDTGKIAAELDWRPAIGFATGLERTVDWYLNNPSWIANITSGAYRSWIERQYA